MQALADNRLNRLCRLRAVGVGEDLGAGDRFAEKASECKRLDVGGARPVDPGGDSYNVSVGPPFEAGKELTS